MRTLLKLQLSSFAALMLFTSVSFADDTANPYRQPYIYTYPEKPMGMGYGVNPMMMNPMTTKTPSLGYPVKPMPVAFDNSRQALHLCLSAVTGFSHVDVDHPDAHLEDINRNLNNPNGTYNLLKTYLELKSLRNKGAPAFLTTYGQNDEIQELTKGFCACEKVKGIDMEKLKIAKASLLNKDELKAKWSPMAEAATLRAEHLECK